MRAQLYTLIALLASAASANYCVRDACQDAIKSGPKNCPTAQASVKRDCSSFLRSTVTPCPVTKTQTVTKTATPGTTIASCSTVTSTTTLIRGTTLTTVSTLTSSVTDETSVTVTGDNTITVSTTETVGSTVTMTTTTIVTSTVSVPLLKSREEHEFEERSGPKCPSTSKPTRIPAYASNCRAPSAYASACSCLGYRASPTTVARKTTTVHKTVTYKPTVTRGDSCTTTVFKRTTVDSTAVATSLTTVTETTSVTDTVTVTPTTTIITTSTTETTVTATATQTQIVDPNCYNFAALNGTYVGQTLRDLADSVFFDTDPTSATTYRFNSQNQIYSNTPSRVLGTGVDYQAAPVVNDDPSVSNIPLACFVGSGGLSCSYKSGTPSVLIDCPLRFGSRLAVSPDADEVNCEVVAVGAVQRPC